MMFYSGRYTPKLKLRDRAGVPESAPGLETGLMTNFLMV